MEVHKTLGKGFNEIVYKEALQYEFSQKGIPFERQVDIPITYDGLVFEEGLRIDVWIDKLVICELKAKDELNEVWKAQIISHLQLTGMKLGFLINFNVALIKDGIFRFRK